MSALATIWRPPPGGPAALDGAAGARAVAPLAELLRRGGILAVPTESSYGLAVDPASAVGVAALFRLKGRPADRPLPVVIADRGQLAALGCDPEAADAGEAALLDRLMACWPAPLSLVLPLTADRPLPAAAGGDSLAVRVPDQPLLVRLLRQLGPLTATSANQTGSRPLTTAAAAAELLAGADAAVIDGGTLPGGPPSTLVRPFLGGRRGEPGGDRFELIRAGRFPVDQLRRRTDERQEPEAPIRVSDEE